MARAKVQYIYMARAKVQFKIKMGVVLKLKPVHYRQVPILPLKLSFGGLFLWHEMNMLDNQQVAMLL